MWAMIVKEFRQMRRDRRTLAMMIIMPVLLLVVLGYAARFYPSSIPVAVAGPDAAAAERLLPKSFDVVSTDAAGGRSWAQDELRDGHAAVAVITGGAAPAVLVDGSQLLTAQSALAGLQQLRFAQPTATTPGPKVSVTVLYNPGLSSSDVMIPGLAGVVLVFVGTVITSLGVVGSGSRETLEQLAVMPLRPRDVFLGKIVPYFVVATVDLAIVLSVGIAVFGVPFRGSWLVFGLGALLFLFRHPRPRRADQHGVAEPGAGDPAGHDDDAAAGAAFWIGIPAVIGRGRSPVDRLPAAAYLLQRDREGRDAARRAHRPALAAVPLPRGARDCDRYARDHAIPQLSRRPAPSRPRRGRGHAGRGHASRSVASLGVIAGEAEHETGGLARPGPRNGVRRHFA